MRVWLKDSERRPDPVPVKTDSRAALYVGLVLWLLALVALLLAPELLNLDEAPWRVATCVVGLVLGALGLLYLRFRKNG
ncbi:uncharacterized protein DUF2530 [Glaciihabitans tibetensis]|uniref:Uncharacterized protein DUF2530 n=1 Tax=Glaciihabitans tibetensis TaxID=1266600 RepID=A0A2T0VAG0_9MICO|nr:DUF2530 domain-containing protein [Glaciihabitans tibetensis]PRY67185.1 uncharacterized protein DUF2530 [Glaciihabitans tibetensis]